MTEQQFWESNPRIIKVWEKAFKDNLNLQNTLLHSWVGSYGISALTFAIDHCLNGRKAKAKYIDKPIEVFPEVKQISEEQKAENALNRFKLWADSMMTNYK